MLKKNPGKKTRKTYKLKGKVTKNQIDRRILKGILSQFKRLGNKLAALEGHN